MVLPNISSPLHQKRTTIIKSTENNFGIVISEYLHVYDAQFYVRFLNRSRNLMPDESKQIARKSIESNSDYCIRQLTGNVLP